MKLLESTKMERGRSRCKTDYAEEKAQKRRDSFKVIGIGTDQDTRAVASLRNLSFDGAALAFTRGVLRFGPVRGQDCWIVTDQSGRAAEARRLDGKPFTYNDHSFKGSALAGSDKSWPVGLDPVFRMSEDWGQFKTILFVEGQPDLIAAYHYIAKAGRGHDTIAVAMLGATSSICDNAIERFKGKDVIFFPHMDADGGGIAAVMRWASQIKDKAFSIGSYSFEGLVQECGDPVGDLNDLTTTTINIFD